MQRELLDFTKAFDSLEKKNLTTDVSLIRAFSFQIGDNFIKWVKVLYSKLTICVKNNNWQPYPFN